MAYNTVNPSQVKGNIVDPLLGKVDVLGERQLRPDAQQLTNIICYTYSSNIYSISYDNTGSTPVMKITFKDGKSSIPAPGSTYQYDGVPITVWEAIIRGHNLNVASNATITNHSFSIGSFLYDQHITGRNGWARYPYRRIG